MMSLQYMARTLLVVASLSPPAWGDIYAYTAADGAVSLSNVPTDDRYTVLVAAAQPAVVAAAPTAVRPEKRAGVAGKNGYDQIVDMVSRKHGLESALVHAVISVESHYNPKALSRKGAMGLMQLMPQTAKRYGVVDAFDPRQNLNGGARYLKDLLHRFDNDVSLALAAYNAGEHAVAKYGNRIPPYRETMRYVPRVLDFYRRYQAGL
jgi:soluble lytic murein transglycosylase-like protein